MRRARSCRRALASAAAFALATAACSTVVVTPIAGPAPRTILVLPPRDPDASPAAPRLPAATLAAGADLALRGRGYRVVPLDVGFDLARQVAGRAPLPADAGEHLLRAANADALLYMDVATFATEGASPLRSAAWQVAWRLVGRDGAELWRHDESGSYVAGPAERDDDRGLLPDEPQTVAFGATRARYFRDATDLAAALHRLAFAHLPRCTP